MIEERTDIPVEEQKEQLKTTIHYFTLELLLSHLDGEKLELIKKEFSDMVFEPTNRIYFSEVSDDEGTNMIQNELNTHSTFINELRELIQVDKDRLLDPLIDYLIKIDSDIYSVQ